MGIKELAFVAPGVHTPGVRKRAEIDPGVKYPRGQKKNTPGSRPRGAFFLRKFLTSLWECLRRSHLAGATRSSGDFVSCGFSAKFFAVDHHVWFASAGVAI